MRGRFFGEIYLRAGFLDALLLVVLDRDLQGFKLVLKL